MRVVALSLALALISDSEISYIKAYGMADVDRARPLQTDTNRESIFLYLVDELLGKTGLPWEWEGYVPYDRR